MRLHIALLLLTLHCLAEACEPEQAQNGCKIYGSACTCGYGCKVEYIYRTRRACLNALRATFVHMYAIDDGPDKANAMPTERSSNVCSRMPCMRGICIQTVQDPGFTCKCEGTGYYGQRCEKACPTATWRGLVFPHECVVI